MAVYLLMMLGRWYLATPGEVAPMSRVQDTLYPPPLLFCFISLEKRRNSQSILDWPLRADVPFCLLPLLGLCCAGPARDRTGAAGPPDGRAADPAAAGDGGRSALARKRGEISGNCVSSHSDFFHL